MNDCGAGCSFADDEVACYAECNSECGAQCELVCEDDYDDDYADDYDDEYADDYDDEYADDYDDDYYDPDYYGRGYDDRGRGKVEGRHKREGTGPGRIKRGKGQSRNKGHYTVDTTLDIASPWCADSCQQSCGGSCAADVTRDCELGCQAARAVDCQGQMSASCNAACDTGGVVLMCDGQYVDAPDVGACVAQLERVGVEVEGSESSIGQISVPEAGNLHKAASCSVEEPTRSRFAGAMFALLSFGFGATFLRRRRQR